MAAADDELSNQVIRGDNSDIGDGGSENEEASAERTEPKQASAYGVFTGSLVYGNGIHAELAETDVDFEDATIGTAPADYDGDGEITFNETDVSRRTTVSQTICGCIRQTIRRCSCRRHRKQRRHLLRKQFCIMQKMERRNFRYLIRQEKR